MIFFPSLEWKPNGCCTTKIDDMASRSSTRFGGPTRSKRCVRGDGRCWCGGGARGHVGSSLLVGKDALGRRERLAVRGGNSSLPGCSCAVMWFSHQPDLTFVTLRNPGTLRSTTFLTTVTPCYRTYAYFVQYQKRTCYCAEKSIGKKRPSLKVCFWMSSTGTLGNW